MAVSGEDARRWPIADFEALEEPPEPEPLPEEGDGAAGPAAGGPAAEPSVEVVPPAVEEPAPAGVRPTVEPRERSRIVVTGRESEVADQALAALAAGSRDLFVRGGVLVEVLSGEPAMEEAPRAAAVQEARRIVAAALTLLRAYVAAGRPPQDLSGMGSFEEWSALVRSAVVFHGLPDPAVARMSRSEPGAPGPGAEPEASAAFARGVEELLTALGGQATARRMVETLAEEAHREAFGVLRAALRRLYPGLAGGLPTARQLGYTLRSLSGRDLGGRRIVQARKNTRGVTWSVRKTGTS